MQPPGFTLLVHELEEPNWSQACVGYGHGNVVFFFFSFFFLSLYVCGALGYETAWQCSSYNKNTLIRHCETYVGGVYTPCFARR